MDKIIQIVVRFFPKKRSIKPTEIYRVYKNYYTTASPPDPAGRPVTYRKINKRIKKEIRKQLLLNRDKKVNINIIQTITRKWVKKNFNQLKYARWNSKRKCAQVIDETQCIGFDN